MSKYEFSLRQEVLLEKGASVLGSLFHYRQAQGIDSDTHPVSILYDLVWNVKQDILLAKNESDLEQIEGQLNMANSFLAGMESAVRA